MTFDSEVTIMVMARFIALPTYCGAAGPGRMNHVFL